MELDDNSMKASVYKVNLPDESSKMMVIRNTIMKLAAEVAGQIIIYIWNGVTALMLRDALVEDGYAVALTLGADRDKLGKDFNDGLIKVLISTDIIAWGIDQSKVNLVVNFDPPVDYPYDNATEPYTRGYKARISKAGWFGGKGGAVFNLICGHRENMLMEKIQRDFNHNVTEVPSWNSDDDFKDALEKAGFN
ncbi:putative RNA helicase [Helianthus debilis subsp. tardiflorus]